MTLWDDCTECWDFDGDAAAQKDASHDLTANNTPGYGSTSPPQGTGYADLDNDADEYFSLSDDSDFDVGANDYSIAFWMYAHAVGGAYIASKMAPYEAGWLIAPAYISGSRYDLQVQHRYAWSSSNSISGWSIQTGAWYHVVVSYDYSAGQITWWISSESAFGDQLDGSAVSVSLQPGTNSASLFLAAESSTATLDGRLDEFLFFNGKALTAAEAESIYDGSWREVAGATYQDTAADGFNLGEGTSRIISMLATATDGLGVVESTARVATILATASDGLGVGESPANIAALLASALDGITTADLSGAEVGIYLTATDGITLGDAGANSATLQAAGADGLTISEAVSVIAILAALAADGAVFGDAVAGDLSGALSGEAVDGLSIGDAGAAIASFVSAITDALNLGDQASSIATLLASALDGFYGGDAATWQAAIDAIAADGAAFGESAQVVLSMISAAIDGVTVSDSGTIRADFVVVATDGASFGATVGAVMTILAGAADGFGMGDLAAHFQAHGIVTMSISGKRAAISVTVKKPGITLE